jgi:dipeptidyl aminopeptidase/acylaminoacyl peptidase
LLLDQPVEISCPVHILQGMKDPDVPWQHALKLMEKLSGNPALTLIKNGDHRLSTPEDVALITHTLEAILATGTSEP